MKVKIRQRTLPNGSKVDYKSKQIRWSTFDRDFKPQLNHFNNDPNGNFNGCLYETYGEEVQFVCDMANHPTDHLRVWTVLEGGSGKWYISEGFHLVNRVGYLVTEVPREADITYEDIFYL